MQREAPIDRSDTDSTRQRAASRADKGREGAREEVSAFFESQEKSINKRYKVSAN